MGGISYFYVFSLVKISFNFVKYNFLLPKTKGNFFLDDDDEVAKNKKLN